MKTKILFLSFLSIAVMALYSCSGDDDTYTLEDGIEDSNDSDNTTIPEDTGDSEDEELVPNSQNVSYENAVTITFSSDGASINNPFENNGVTISNDNGHVVITSSITDSEINYIFSGITSNGSVKIYGEKKIGLILNGVGITNPTGAAINIQNKKKCSVIIVDNTNNRLIDGAEYTYTTDEDMKGTFFSEGNMEISGGGNLEIRGKNKHALCVDGSLSVSNGVINIKEAASDGIHTNDEIAITGGALTIRSTKEGIECESETEAINITGGNISIITTGETAHAIKAEYNINIDTGGTIDITVYGNASKGIKPTGDIIISNGNITINTAGNAIWESDEQDISSSAGIKCDGNFLMENGTLTILSTGKGGKGINADGTLVINNGDITVTTTGARYVYNSSNDTAAKAVKSDGDLTINGGTIKIRTSNTDAEGLESKAILTITGGSVDIEAYDDCINATTQINISGGNVYCSSTTNDAIDSNGQLSISGGVVVVAGASSPEGGIDCDNSRFVITGGTIIGIGGATSTPTTNYCTQRSVVFNSSSSNVQIVRIETTSGGNEALTFKLPKTYSSQMTMLFSSPLLAANTGYTIYTGGSISGGSEYHGYYTGATYTKGSSTGTFTTGSSSGSVSTVGNSNGMNGGRW